PREEQYGRSCLGGMDETCARTAQPLQAMFAQQLRPTIAGWRCGGWRAELLVTGSNRSADCTEASRKKRVRLCSREHEVDDLDWPEHACTRNGADVHRPDAASSRHGSRCRLRESRVAAKEWLADGWRS